MNSHETLRPNLPLDELDENKIISQADQAEWAEKRRQRESERIESEITLRQKLHPYEKIIAEMLENVLSRFPQPEVNRLLSGTLPHRHSIIGTQDERRPIHPSMQKPKENKNRVRIYTSRDIDLGIACVDNTYGIKTSDDHKHAIGLSFSFQDPLSKERGQNGYFQSGFEKIGIEQPDWAQRRSSKIKLDDFGRIRHIEATFYAGLPKSITENFEGIVPDLFVEPLKRNENIWGNQTINIEIPKNFLRKSTRVKLEAERGFGGFGARPTKAKFETEWYLREDYFRTKDIVKQRTIGLITTLLADTFPQHTNDSLPVLPALPNDYYTQIRYHTRQKL